MNQYYFFEIVKKYMTYRTVFQYLTSGEPFALCAYEDSINVTVRKEINKKPIAAIYCRDTPYEFIGKDLRNLFRDYGDKLVFSSYVPENLAQSITELKEYLLIRLDQARMAQADRTLESMREI